MNPIRIVLSRKNILSYFIQTVSLLVLLSCGGTKEQKKEDPKDDNLIPYKIGGLFPHDQTAFTQGLVIEKGKLYESTGQSNSWIAEVNITTGEQNKKVTLEKKYFGEGITILNNKVYQLTWQSHVGFVYDLTTFAKLREFKYDHEGWGITHDGKELIVSDGTSTIYFKDTLSFEDKHTITVKENEKPVSSLNELEYIDGYIYANQWQTSYIFKINPANGNVEGKLDLTSVVNEIKGKAPNADVLNGIAYEKKSNMLLITGKLWPAVYAIRLQKPVAAPAN